MPYNKHAYDVAWFSRATGWVAACRYLAVAARLLTFVVDCEKIFVVSFSCNRKIVSIKEYIIWLNTGMRHMKRRNGRRRERRSHPEAKAAVKAAAAGNLPVILPATLPVIKDQERNLPARRAARKHRQGNGAGESLFLL